MTAREVLAEFLFPARHAAVFIALLACFLLLELAAFAGIFGVFLALLLIPALLRYLMLLLAARTRGADPGPPGGELFAWTGSAWSLFPAVHIALLGYTGFWLGQYAPAFVAGGVIVLLLAVTPASLAVLAISRSPLESLRPGAIAYLVRRCHPGYWIAPAYACIAIAAILAAGGLPVPGLARDFVAFYLLFAGFAISGAVVRAARLDRDLRIPDPVLPDAGLVGARLEKDRSRILDHAYGMISRGNRAGGLEHVYKALQDDPEPRAAWRWYFEGMLSWERNEAALQFAQQFLARLLEAGDQVAAVKLMLRCRLVNADFQPLPEDRALALEAAEQCHNDALAGLLR